MQQRHPEGAHYVQTHVDTFRGVEHPEFVATDSTQMMQLRQNPQSSQDWSVMAQGQTGQFDDFDKSFED